MAKRKRLTPANLPQELETKSANPGLAPPIAQVAGASAAFSAARDLEDQMGAARAEGRLIIALPLDAIEESHLMRDRLGVVEPEMEALKASLRAHGQRTAIEVEDLGQGRFGLISGWRRLTALKALAAQTGEDRFAKVTAIIRTPQDRAEAYIAMVEENEIRAGLSYYERARVAARAADQGAFASAEAAVDTLFAAGSRARRSKIRSFLRIHSELEAVLQFPTALSERLGLKIAEALKNGQAKTLCAALAKAEATTPEAEATIILKTLSGSQKKGQKSGTDKAVLLRNDGLILSAKASQTGFSFAFEGVKADEDLQRKLSEILIEALRKSENYIKK